MADQDIAADLQERIRKAAAEGTALSIAGGHTKSFYGRPAAGLPLDVSGHRGLVNYEPTELVITARAGTPLREIETLLADSGQMLPFEPPQFGADATLGGTVACNLSGPRRPYTGAARDFVLGTRIINGKGESLSFGGEVMKNVAGYDVSRLMVGALGTLGVLLEISLKVLPLPESEITLSRLTTAHDALEQVQAWGRLPLPISATCWDGTTLYTRLSGSAGAVQTARKQLGGDEVDDGEQLWRNIKERCSSFFNTGQNLWRFSIASDVPPMDLAGDWLYEWGGAQRWLKSDADFDRIQAIATAAGGHATLVRSSGDRNRVFQPLSTGLLQIHKRLKQAFDPAGILNPERMYIGV